MKMILIFLLMPFSIFAQSDTSVAKIAHHEFGNSYFEKCGCKPPVYECKNCGKMIWSVYLLPDGYVGEHGFYRLSDSLKKKGIKIEEFLFTKWNGTCLSKKVEQYY